jgi:hypothetical protein
MTPPIQTALDPEARFTGLPVLTEYIDGDVWRLARNVVYRVAIGRLAGRLITIRSGFIFNWASTPSLLWFCLPPAGKAGNPYGIAALVHDWLYEHQAINGEPITRQEADEVFNEVLRYVGVHRWLAATMWAGVRIGGWLPWWRNGDAKAEAEFLKLKLAPPPSSILPPFQPSNLPPFQPSNPPTLQDAPGIGLLGLKPQGGAEDPASVLQKSSVVLQKVSETPPPEGSTP